MSFRGNFWGFWGYLWGGRITMPGLRAGLEPAPTKDKHGVCKGGFKTRPPFQGTFFLPLRLKGQKEGSS